MPGCCVQFCRNRSEKGYRLFQFPGRKRNSERRSEWLKFINKEAVSERTVISKFKNVFTLAQPNNLLVLPRIIYYTGCPRHNEGYWENR
ncbi:hypothetical protein PUN28_020813 [Cardiocondyla obscurior]|uniref:THAP-type domain-containing protein n=1 Tax=Cardiocondyla obscurior TaxID=286306 RepID=A0AAW2E7C2_9HYME